MNIWIISDTHNQHEQLKVPDVDLAIHCGDESTQGSPWLNEPEARAFFEWYSAIDVPTKIFVPGNHSTALAKGLVVKEDFPAIQFLIHEEMVWQGLKIFGSPYTPRFFNWAYMKARNKLDLVWQTIPDDIDILITHGPPKGVLDITHDYESGHLVQVGCAALRRHVDSRIMPKIHAFGHLHDERGISNYGMYTRGGTKFVNCAVCNLVGVLKHNGFVVDVS